MLIKFIFSLLSRLPLGAHHFIGRSIGRVLFYFNNRTRHISTVNINLCFPRLTTEEKELLLKTTLKENGMTLIECFWLWLHPQQALTAHIGQIENKHLLDNASKHDYGTIFVTPHFGSWEFIGLLTAAHCDLLILYAPPKSEHIHQLSCTGRASSGGSVISTEKLNLKVLIKHIKSGGSVGILPDQVPDGNGGIYSRFFNRQCYTSTLVCKLANKLKCPVVFCYALRTQGQRRKYNAYYYESPKAIYDDNLELATDALNARIEQCINTAPAQYIWGYKRFKRPASGDKYPY